MRPLNQIANWGEVTKEQFDNEIQPLGQPAVFRQQIASWPAVQEGAKGSKHFLQYLKKDSVGGKGRFLSLPADEDGYFFYNKDYSGFNFERKIASLDTIFQLMLERVNNSKLDSIAMQSAPIDEYFKTLSKHNQLELFSSDVSPRIWLGNQGRVNTHYDDSENLACVVAGKRTFTLFPPEQIANLYIGPLENTPGGAPVSMVKLLDPDLEKFPKFSQALNYGLTADLVAGDVIYIPALWWHHVEAKSDLNCLVNYWQGGSIQGLPHPSGLDAVLMGLISIGRLPENQKKAWSAIFNHIVLSNEQDFSYIPRAICGAIGNRSNSEGEEALENVKAWLKIQIDK